MKKEFSFRRADLHLPNPDKEMLPIAPPKPKSMRLLPRGEGARKSIPNSHTQWTTPSFTAKPTPFPKPARLGSANVSSANPNTQENEKDVSVSDVSEKDKKPPTLPHKPVHIGKRDRDMVEQARRDLQRIQHTETMKDKAKPRPPPAPRKSVIIDQARERIKERKRKIAEYQAIARRTSEAESTYDTLTVNGNAGPGDRPITMTLGRDSEPINHSVEVPGNETGVSGSGVTDEDKTTPPKPYEPVHISKKAREIVENASRTLQSCEMKEKARVQESKVLMANDIPLDEPFPLLKAARLGKDNVIRFLVNNGKDPNQADSSGQTALHALVQAKEHISECVEFLVSNGADPNAKTRDGFTTLHFAVNKNDAEHALTHDEKVTVEILIQNGANPNEKNNHGDAPLHTANPCFIKILIQNGANPNEKNSKSGDTPLHNAARSNKVQAIDELVENGARCDEKNNGGDTALHVATASGKQEAVTTLCTLGARLDVRNKSGQTVLDISRTVVHQTSSHAAILNFLEGGSGIDLAKINLAKILRSKEDLIREKRELQETIRSLRTEVFELSKSRKMLLESFDVEEHPIERQIMKAFIGLASGFEMKYGFHGTSGRRTWNFTSDVGAYYVAIGYNPRTRKYQVRNPCSNILTGYNYISKTYQIDMLRAITKFLSPSLPPWVHMIDFSGTRSAFELSNRWASKPNVRDALGLIMTDADKGTKVICTNVYNNSRAARAGLKKEDEIHSVWVDQKEVWASKHCRCTRATQEPVWLNFDLPSTFPQLLHEIIPDALAKKKLMEIVTVPWLSSFADDERISQGQSPLPDSSLALAGREQHIPKYVQVTQKMEKHAVLRVVLHPKYSVDAFGIARSLPGVVQAVLFDPGTTPPIIKFMVEFGSGENELLQDVRSFHDQHYRTSGVVGLIPVNPSKLRFHNVNQSHFIQKVTLKQRHVDGLSQTHVVVSAEIGDLHLPAIRINSATDNQRFVGDRKCFIDDYGQFTSTEVEKISDRVYESPKDPTAMGKNVVGVITAASALWI